LIDQQNIIEQNYGSPTKLFTDLYLAKFLDTSAKSFFPWLTFQNYVLSVTILKR